MKSEFLYHLARVAKKKHQRDRIIRRASKEQLNLIRNICFNLCKCKIQLPSKTRQKLLRFKRDIRDLASKQKLATSQGLKRRLVQKGGFLPLLLPAVLGLVSSVGGKLLAKAIGV